MLTDIRYAVSGPVATITLDRPQARNAYSDAMLKGLVTALDAAEADEAVRCIIVTGAGKGFHAGGDLKVMREQTGMFHGDPVRLRRQYIDGIHRVPRRIEVCDKPIIAAINGAAIGAGLDLACMCDIRLASESAKMGSTFVKVGLVPGDGGAYFLARVVGFPRALEMILTGRLVEASEALKMGLVHEVVPPQRLLEAAREKALSIAENSPLAVRLAKRATYRSWDSDVHTALELAASYQGMAQNTSDHLEAVAAILDKRKPSFHGK